MTRSVVLAALCALALAVVGLPPAGAGAAEPGTAPSLGLSAAAPASAPDEEPTGSDDSTGSGDEPDEKEPDGDESEEDKEDKEPPKPPKPPTGRVVGRVVDPTGQGVPGARVAVFDLSWQWLRAVTARSTGRFTLDLAPGRYRLQATDSRPAWRTDRRAPADATVDVRVGHDTTRSMTLRRGAHVTGSVVRGPRDRAASRALVRATDEVGRTFEVRADGGGGFALGGLPPGTFRLWGYDRGRRWVGRTVHVGWLGRGDGRHVQVRMRTRAGGLNGYVKEGPRIARSTTWVTAISRRTGQWWVVKARSGDLSLRGLAPGRYTFVVTGTAAWQGRTIRPRTKVVPGRTREVTLRLNRPVEGPGTGGSGPSSQA